MSRLRFGVAFWQTLPFARLAELGVIAEGLGFDTVWYSNHKLYRDMFMGLTLLAVKTQRIRLGTFVAEPYSRHPALIAASIASLDEIAGGRAVLGLGVGGVNFRELGLQRVRPARAIEESIALLRPLLAGEGLTFEGQLFSLNDGRLQMPARRHIPIVIASRGDRVLETAGRLADGVMLATYATPRGQHHARTVVARGAEKAGRRVGKLELIIRVDVNIDEDAAAARAAVRPMIALMLMSSYPDRTFVERIGLELSPELEAMCSRKNEAAAFASADLIPDEFVKQYAWAGTAQQVTDQISPLVEMGFRSIAIMPQPMERDPLPVMSVFAKRVVPALRKMFE